jgi:hypothetical protein
MILPASMDFNISKEKTRKELMNLLPKLYEKSLASNKVFLIKRLFNMNMSEGGSIVDHLNEFNMVNSNLSSIKLDLDDDFKDLLILCSLLQI